MMRKAKYLSIAVVCVVNLVFMVFRPWGPTRRALFSAPTTRPWSMSEAPRSQPIRSGGTVGFTSRALGANARIAKTIF